MGTRTLPSPGDSRVADRSTAVRPDTPDAAIPSIEDLHARPRWADRAWAREVVPLLTSIVLHAAIVAIGFATYQTVKVLRDTSEVQVNTGTFFDETEQPVGGPPTPGPGGDPTRPVAQDEVKDVDPTPKWDKRPESLGAVLDGGATDGPVTADLAIGPRLTRGATGGPSGVMGPPGAGRPRFGPPGGGGSFMDLPIGPGPVGRGNVTRVAYVCDATGTMLGLKFELLKQQLSKSIDGLKPVHAFNVIFFRGGSSDGEWAAPMAKALLPANPKHKRTAFEFVNGASVLGNGTNPLPALRQAFAQRPQVVYFLTDGEFNNFASYDDVLAEVGRMNAGRAVVVHTILLMSDDAKAEATLRKLASENGGLFRKVSEADLR